MTDRLTGKKATDCKKIWAVVVTYNIGVPFAHHIKTYLHQVDKVILVDNSTKKLSRAIAQTIAEELPKKVELIQNKGNVGLAKAQNQGIAKAVKEGAQWVMLLDDDSSAEPDMMQGMKDALKDHSHPEDIGILAPVIFDENTNKPQPFITKWGPFFRRRTLMSEGHSLDDVMAVIAAGSLIRREVFEDIGLMRHDYIIDYVDTEFCLRARTYNWFILAAGGAHLNHEIGAKTLHRFLLFFKFYTSNHNAERRYTIYRNRVCMWKAYWKSVRPYIIYDMMAVPYDLFRILFFEEDRKAKIKSILRGLKHGLFWLKKTPKEGFPSFKDI